MRGASARFVRCPGEQAVIYPARQQLEHAPDEAHLPWDHGVCILLFDDTYHALCSLIGIQYERHRVGVNGGHRGLDIARTDRDDFHTAAMQFHPQRFQIRDGGGLGGGIGTRPWQAAKASHAGDADQRSPFCRTHHRNEGLEGFYDAQYIDIHHPLKSIDVFGVFGECAYTYPGVGDDDIRQADTCDEIVCRMLYGSRIPHVQRVTKYFAGKFCTERLQQLTAPGECGDRCAAFEIMARERKSQAARRAAYDQRLGWRYLPA